MTVWLKIQNAVFMLLGRSLDFIATPSANVNLLAVVRVTAIVQGQLATPSGLSTPSPIRVARSV